MKLRSVRLHHIEVPLVSPFTTSFGTQLAKRCFLVEAHLETADGRIITGWGENVAMDEPVYSPEYRDGASDVIERWLAPMLARVEDLTAETVGHHLHHIVGHAMAKGSLEMAVLDGQLRADGRSLASYLGAVSTTIPSGVSVGIQETVEDTVRVVGRYIDEGYARIKLKIAPGRDVAEVAAVRQTFGDELLFQVDANAAYTLVDAAHLRRLDDYGLLLIEQPLGEADIRQHAELAKQLSTPICLDESIVSARSGGRRDLARCRRCDQYQARPRRRLPRSASHP